MRDADTYAGLRTALRDALEDRTYAVARDTAAVLTAARELVHDGFVADAGAARLPHLVRYLRGARYRLAKAMENPARDESSAWQVAEVAQAYDDAVAASRTATPDAARNARLAMARWMLEELRVSLFAQQLGTAQPVSAKRIRNVLAG